MAERRFALTLRHWSCRFARALAGTVSLACLLASGSPAQAVQLSSARVIANAEYTRIVLEASAPLNYKVFVVPDPDRLVLDIEEAQEAAVLDLLARQIAPDDTRVRGVRIGKYQPGVLRVVFDLKSQVHPQAYRWRTGKEGSHHLILDIHSAAPPDPLMSLLRAPAADNGAARAAPADAPPLPRARPGPDTAETFGRFAVADAATVAGPRKTMLDADVASAEKPGPRAKPPAALPEPGAEEPRVERLITVAVDAGHGGEDPGARGQEGTLEKHVTLAVARKLKAILDDQPNMRAVLVRDADVFVPLHHRVIKARNVQADLFVSIHADAFIRPNARGSSVFALSERGATSAAARWIAKRENEADLIGGVNLDVPDPNLKRVLLDLSQTATINDSLKLARAVLRELSGVNTLHKSHVEQAGFAVLKAPDIPSVLVETAFISNPAEEERLNDEAYQERLAGAIASGIKRYFSKNPPLARARMARSDTPDSYVAPAAFAAARDPDPLDLPRGEAGTGSGAGVDALRPAVYQRQALTRPAAIPVRQAGITTRAGARGTPPSRGRDAIAAGSRHAMPKAALSARGVACESRGHLCRQSPVRQRAPRPR